MRYRKIDPRIWNDAKFMAMSDSGKLVFFMLLTHPHMTCLGAMRATIPGLAAELGWSEKAFREAFQEALDKGMVEADEKASFLVLPNFVKYNPPESPNVVKAWPQALDLLPECSLKIELVQSLKVLLEGFTEGFREAFAKGMPKTMPNQEQEQEQDYISCAELAHEQAHAPDDAHGPEDKQPAPSPKPADAPPVYSLPCNGTKKIYHVTSQTHAKLVAAYPGVDVMAEYAKMDAWLETNAKKRKTHQGMGKFINSWLGRAQNDARGQPRQSQPTLFAGPPEPQSVSNEECQRLYGY